MKRIYLYLLPLFCAIVFLPGEVIAQTTVYLNAMPGTGGTTTVPGGTPALTFTNAGASSALLLGSNGVQLGGLDAIGTSFTSNQLATWVDAQITNNDGYAMTSAPITGYSAPFSATLSSNPGLVTWTFNIRTSSAATGYTTTTDNAAVVLAATSATFRTAGNGYAVAFSPTSTGARALQLIRYTGGLTGTITNIITAPTLLAAATRYASVSITYSPTGNLWSMYLRDDGASAFTDPATGTLSAMGSASDATYTGTAMSRFGFYCNYHVTATFLTSNAKFAYFDNYKVTVGCSLPAITGTSSVCVGGTTTFANTTTGGTWSSSATGTATVSSSGVINGVLAGTATITYTTSASCFTTRVVTVNALPTVFAVTGGGAYCSGGTGVGIGMVNSQSGINYQLYNGASTVGSPAGGTGGSFLFGSTFTTAGTYTVQATNATTGCVSNMSGSVTIIINPLPAAISGPATVCQGSTATYSDITTTGTWSSSNTTVATIVSGTGVLTALTSGTTTLSYILPTGCYTTTPVTVNPVAAITGTAVLCMSSTTTLTNPVTGGTWLSGDGSIFTIGSSDGVVTPVGAGTAAVTYTTPAGCPVYGVVTVNPLPAAIGGPSEVCEGLTITLSNTSTGGAWASGTTSVATIDAIGVVSGIVFGTSVITYTLPTGCSITKVITVNPVPAAITGTLAVCHGLTTSLSNATSGGTWSSNNTPVASINSSGVVTGNSPGNATISYTITTTGCYSTAIVTVNPLPAAISGPTAVCVGQTVTLTNTGGGGWTSGTTSVATIGASSGIVSGGTAGTTIITYTLPTGCITTRVETVNPLPAAITGTAAVCAGLTTTLSTTTGSGTWTSSNTSVATINSSGVVTGVVAGNATITFTITATGCYTTRIVTVNPLPSTITGTQAVCVGLTTTLGSTPTTGTWTSGNTAAGTIGASNGVVTGIAAGTTIITYTLPTGCIRTAIVTVNPLPANISGTPVVCVNSSTTLANSTGSGTWSSNNTAVATVGATNGGVFGVSAGNATVSYILTATGCYVTTPVTVNPLPSAITGPAYACLGNTTTMSSLPNTGTWTSANTSLATVGASNGVVTGVALGTVNITYTLSTGCYVTRNLTVSSLPATITGPSYVCANSSTITLSTASSGGAWTSSNSTLATIGASSGIVTGLSAGTVTMSYTFTITGCYATTLVTVMPMPVGTLTPIGDTVFCPGGFVTLTAATGTGYTYQWNNTAGPIPGATSSTYIATAADAYSADITSPYGCVTNSIPMTATIDLPPASITVSGGGAAAACAGSTVTLDANTGTGLSYQWQQDGVPIPGAIGNSYTTTTAGDFTVIVSNTGGCWSVSVPTTVTINPLPSGTITASAPLTFCAGGSTTLSTDVDPSYTYQWYSGAGVIAGATSSSYAISASGSYWVVVNSSAGCNTTSPTTGVVVNALPSAGIVAAGPTIFCTGNTVTLNATSGSFTYQWFLGSTAIPGATNATYVASATGGYRVKVTNTGTGCSATTAADTMVTSVGVPSIVPISSTSYCWGGSALLSTSASGLAGAVSFQWFKDGVAIPGAIGSMYNATSPANYRCTITVPASCSMTTTDATVTEKPLPNPVIAFNGITFSVANYFTSYQWYKDAIVIPGATSWSTPATANGNYKVAVTDTNGCQSMSAVYVLTGWNGSTAVATVGAEDIAIYPNPTTAMVHIAADRSVKVNVNAMDGRALVHDVTTTDIDLSMLANGIYIIQVYDNEGLLLKTVRMVKNGN